jgi:tetratricopeptide (TPR) repeat protein
MKKYLICIIELFYLLVTLNVYAENQVNVCDCLHALRGYNILYKKAWIGSGSQNSPNYPYALESASIQSKMNFDPTYYFEYYHNLHVFNDSLTNYLNYKMNECERYPTLYGKDRDKVRQDYLKAIEDNDEADQHVRKRARFIYESCYKKHINPMTLYDNGFLEFVEGNADKSIEITEKYIRVCKEHNIDHHTSSAELMLLGQSYIEMAQYFKAIEVLTDLIQKDPTNKEAHFHRAAAYFETGNFDEALADFLGSDKGREISKSNAVASKEFTQALITSLHQGVSESAVDFVPSLCHSVYGLSTALWAMHWSANPVNSEAFDNMKNFANASYEMGTCVINYCKNIDIETINGYVDQIKTLYQHYDQLNDAQKGELIGYTIGRYGVDILAGATAAKGAQFVNKVVPLFRNLRNANQACNLQAMLLSEAEKKAIVASSLTHAIERDKYFKNVKIHWDRQNKHIPGAHNFEVGRGTILINRNLLESLVKENAGKGQKVLGNLGEPGFKERVDFGVIIGDYAQELKGQPTKYIPTSKGIITYAKDGNVHVYPTHPKATFD